MKTVPAFGTSVSRPLNAVATRLGRTLTALLPGVTAAAHEKNAGPVSLQLARGKVHRLDQADGVREIHVLDGVLWLTTTPAEGDIVLRSGERFSAPTTWPIVFEAMKDTSVLLVLR